MGQRKKEAKEDKNKADGSNCARQRKISLNGKKKGKNNAFSKPAIQARNSKKLLMSLM